MRPGPMQAGEVLPAGTWDQDGAIDRVLLDWDNRHRRRIALTCESGRELLLDLPRVARLREGDGLQTAEGVVRVAARPEALLEIGAHDARALVRIAWHLGNRHLPVQLTGDRIRIRVDHVIEQMIRLLGGHTHPILAPFDPEAGAYAGGVRHHHHDHG